MNNILSILQAYRAMQFFLEDYYDKTHSNDLGSLLGGMQLFPEGGTFDPAMWNEWQKSVGKNKNLTILDAFDSMQKFLKIYYNYINSDEIKELIDLMNPSKDGIFDRTIWTKWIDATTKSLKNKA